MASSDDQELAALKTESYRGIARVPLSSLDFRHSLVQKQHREVSLQNVHRIRGIFERMGCLRFEGDNIVNAIIADSDLEEALQSANITTTSFRSCQWPIDAPRLDLTRVKCLSGLHRIEAAKNFLDENDKWWTVRLFSESTPPSLLTRIVESYVNEQKPADGEIFRKIRLYHRANDQSSEDRWWACLDRSKLKDLRQLTKRRQIIAAFDELIDMPGLWAPIQLGALHRLLALKCDEEMVFYLKHIARTWRKILRCDHAAILGQSVDFKTVEKLELLCPKYSTTDKGLLHQLMQQKVLFPLQPDLAARDALFQNVCNLSVLVPSLRTFFEMLKMLEPTCTVLRQLIGKHGFKTTIRSAMMGRYFRPSRIDLQVSEWSDAEITTTLDDQTASRLAYTELWAYCSRHVDDLVSFTPRKESGQARPSVKCRNPVAWHKLAVFALSRGFKLPYAEELVKDDPQLELAMNYLRQANPTIKEFSPEQIKSVRDACQPTAQDQAVNFERDKDLVDVDRRIGRPFAQDFAKDQSYLFLPYLYAQSETNGITHTFSRRDLYATIFGCFKDEIRGIHASRPAPSDRMSIDSIPGDQRDATYAHTQDHSLKEALEEKERSLAQCKRVCSELEEKAQTLVQHKQKLLAKKTVECEKLIEHIASLEKDNRILNSQVKLLTETTAECDKLREQIISLETDKTILDGQVTSLRRQLASLQKNHPRSDTDLRKAIIKTSKEPSTRKRKVALALSVTSSLLRSGSAADLETDRSNQLGPTEKIWTTRQDTSLELFHLKSAVPGEGPKGYSYIFEDGATVGTNIDRVLAIVRKELGSAPAVCTTTRKRIPAVEQAPGIADTNFLVTLRAQRTLFIGSEELISSLLLLLGTVPPDVVSVPGAFIDDEVLPDASTLIVPARRGVPIETEDGHRSQRRVIEDTQVVEDTQVIENTRLIENTPRRDETPWMEMSQSLVRTAWREKSVSSDDDD